MSNYVVHFMGGGQRSLNVVPDVCPYCHKSINSIPITGYKTKDTFDVFFRCPDQQCTKTFIGYYNDNGTSCFFMKRTSIGTLNARTFSESTIKISSQFVKIFNEAFAAEQYGLLEICGVGYRKALEFLIKDYSILNHPSESENIQKLLLSPTIERYVNDDRIKLVAKRAIWLGNDETHYVRKWIDKDVTDLKKLVELTIHWIEMEELTKTLALDMPG